MYFLAWIVIGAVVGWGAGRVFQGNGYGPLMDILMGIGGAIVGGFTMSFAGLGGYGGTNITTLVAMLVQYFCLYSPLTWPAEGFSRVRAADRMQVRALRHSTARRRSTSTSLPARVCAFKLLGTPNVSQ